MSACEFDIALRTCEISPTAGPSGPAGVLCSGVAGTEDPRRAARPRCGGRNFTSPASLLQVVYSNIMGAQSLSQLPPGDPEPSQYREDPGEGGLARGATLQP
jgi:hypothetical protein